VKIAILGCGTMGRSIIAGLMNGRVAASIVAFDSHKAQTQALPAPVSVLHPRQWFTGPQPPDIVVLAVKPQDMDTAVGGVKAPAEESAATPLWVSVAAGIPIRRLQKLLPPSARICRVMPNLPAGINEGALAYVLNKACTRADRKMIECFLCELGTVARVAEKDLDAVTGLSGTGPAFIYLVIESLVEGGVAAGLRRATARRFAVQTVYGAAKMAKTSGEPAGKLMTLVASPHGTTIEGLKVLARFRFKEGVIRAVEAAARRSRELGKPQPRKNGGIHG
jgi:pyrroline-5-carboxylate reductase